MAVKLADTLAPMGDFPVAEGKDVGVQIGEKSKSLQKAIEDGDLGGGGGSSLIDDEVIAEDSTWSSKKISEFGEALDKKVEDVDTKVGDLEELKTTEKGSVVGAVNEISDSLVDLEGMIDGVYTEEEKVIGKWIDGKPIYRKVVKISSIAKEVAFEYKGITNIDTLVSYKGSMNIGVNKRPFPFISYDGNVAVIQLYDTQKISIQSKFDCTNVIVAFEYTKTTD